MCLGISLSPLPSVISVLTEINWQKIFALVGARSTLRTLTLTLTLTPSRCAVEAAIETGRSDGVPSPAERVRVRACGSVVGIF
jgi:hypothetical protein